MIMRFVKLIVAIILLSSGVVYAKSASDTAKDYFAVLKAKNYEEAASFFDPEALKEFRQLMSFINEIPRKGQQQFYQGLFGPDMTVEAAKKFSDPEFFSAFLNAIMSRAEAAGGMSLDKLEIIGEIPEGKNLMHVVTRNRVTTDKIELESMDVISFVRRGNNWKALMSGKIKGMAAQIRAAVMRQ
jgi:predicted house-cleaning noncanonical NTP pyrophosphatase (MazG superfamily)